jgi:hypothetical protein
MTTPGRGWCCESPDDAMRGGLPAPVSGAPGGAKRSTATRGCAAGTLESLGGGDTGRSAAHSDAEASDAAKDGALDDRTAGVDGGGSGATDPVPGAGIEGGVRG